MFWKKKKNVQGDNGSPPEPSFEQPKKPKAKKSMPTREPLLMVACGAKGAGKTVQTCKEIETYVKVHKRPVVIYDVNVETDYAKYKSIRIEDLHKLKAAEIRRVVPFHPDRAPFTMPEKTAALSEILARFRGGCVVIEDINKYTTSTRLQSIISHITTNRHRAQDIMIHVQNISKLDPTLWENANIIRYHAQNEFSPSVRSRLPHLQIITLTDIMLRKALETNPYQFYYIDIQKYAIYGVNKAQFREAAIVYLSRNAKELRMIYDELGTKPNSEGAKDKALDYFVNERKKWLIDDK